MMAKDANHTGLFVSLKVLDFRVKKFSLSVSRGRIKK